MIFEEQNNVANLIYKIMMHTQSLLQCQRCQVMLIDDLCKVSLFLDHQIWPLIVWVPIVVWHITHSTTFTDHHQYTYIVLLYSICCTNITYIFNTYLIFRQMFSPIYFSQSISHKDLSWTSYWPNSCINSVCSFKMSPRFWLQIYFLR